MKTNKLLCLAAALVISASSFAGCADSSSDSASKTSSSSSQSSSSEQNSSSSAADSSEARKINAIGYDVKTSKRLYDSLKEEYGSTGYHLTLKSTANMGSEIFLNVKDGKVSNSDKNQYTNQTMVYTGGDKATIYNHTTKSYREQKVDDPKSFVQKSDILFGLAGDFIEASIDEKNDVINEYYKIKAEAGGSEGIICFCFRGHNGKFAQITVQYENAEFPTLFGITEIKKCDEEAFNAKEKYKEYRKE